ncbi:MAG: nuclear transport factor 2 family protein [Sulfuritalea sp.]|nr:nuclear transport factor 2 family protein [Sulfuritalea sp.]
MNQLTELAVDTPEALAAMYPRLFAKGRLAAWRSLFDDRATLVRTEADQDYRIMEIDAAMPEQNDYADENANIEETWENVAIHRHDRIAVVSADYRVTTDHEVRTGTDVALLARNSDGRWRIVSLAYQQHSLSAR